MYFNLGENKRECLISLQFWGSPSQSNLHAFVSGRSITLPDIRTTEPGVKVSNMEMTIGTTGLSNDNTITHTLIIKLKYFICFIF